MFNTQKYNGLVKYLNQCETLYKYQFNFRATHGTNIALNILVDKISRSLQDGNLVLGVFLDFWKAFDTNNHYILLDKLYCYGIRAAHRLSQGYLFNRKQFFSYDSESSYLLKTECGVPQISISDLKYFYCKVPVSQMQLDYFCQSYLQTKI